MTPATMRPLTAARRIALALLISLCALPALAANNVGGIGGLWSAAVAYNGYYTDPTTGMPTNVVGRFTRVLVASSQAACQIQVDAMLQQTHSNPQVVRPCQQGLVNLEKK
ncbi:MAG: hypothetical protein KF800_12260 [Lysobacter sp.]|nr:hypothetical protein [Lysobacter sp.]